MGRDTTFILPGIHRCLRILLAWWGMKTSLIKFTFYPVSSNWRSETGLEIQLLYAWFTLGTKLGASGTHGSNPKRIEWPFQTDQQTLFSKFFRPLLMPFHTKVFLEDKSHHPLFLSYLAIIILLRREEGDEMILHAILVGRDKLISFKDFNPCPPSDLGKQILFQAKSLQNLSVFFPHQNFDRWLVSLFVTLKGRSKKLVI